MSVNLYVILQNTIRNSEKLIGGGWYMSAEAKGFLKQKSFDTIFCSSDERAKVVAYHLINRYDWKEVKNIERLNIKKEVESKKSANILVVGASNNAPNVVLSLLREYEVEKRHTKTIENMPTRGCGGLVVQLNNNQIEEIKAFP